MLEMFVSEILRDLKEVSPSVKGLVQEDSTHVKMILKIGSSATTYSLMKASLNASGESTLKTDPSNYEHKSSTTVGTIGHLLQGVIEEICVPEPVGILPVPNGVGDFKHRDPFFEDPQNSESSLSSVYTMKQTRKLLNSVAQTLELMGGLRCKRKQTKDSMLIQLYANNIDIRFSLRIAKAKTHPIIILRIGDWVRQNIDTHVLDAAVNHQKETVVVASEIASILLPPLIGSIRSLVNRRWAIHKRAYKETQELLASLCKPSENKKNPFSDPIGSEKGE